MAKTTPRAKLLEDGTLMLMGVIGDEFDGLTAAAVTEEIRGLGEVEDIEVLINSPGGVVTDGLAIYHELATNPARVTVEITGVAASMASAIAMAGNTVRIAKNGHVMIHNPWNVAVGDADDLRKAAEMLDEFGTSLVDIYAEKTGLPEDEIRDMMAEETWMNAEEALEKGFVDEIMGASEAEAFADLDISELASVPAAITRLIREGRQMARTKKNDPEPQGAGEGAENEPDPQEGPTGGEPGATADSPDVNAAATKAAREAVAAERQRTTAIRAMAAKVGLDREWADAQIDEGADLGTARTAALDALASRQENHGPSGIPSRVVIGETERDKWLEGMAAWIAVKAGKASLIAKHTGETFDPGEFRGLSLMDIARDSLHRAGVSTRGMSKMEIAGAALRGGPRAQQAGLGTRSDFPVLLENVLHKMLQAAYGTVPDTWSRFAATGSVSDFRPHPRLRLGSFSSLDDLLESGEFRQKHFPDAEKETITAATKGNIVGITRQAIVNDDVDGFSRLVTMLGRAAALSIEVDVYALLAENSGLGPDMSDGDPLFDANHNNVGTGQAISVEALDDDRVILAQQKDPNDNEFLDLRPAILVVPIGLGGQARVLNEAEFDVDPIDSGTDEQNKFMQPNKVRGLFRDIVDTPRLSGTRRYLFADPDIAPVIEVAFLDGQAAPVIETEEGFDFDGVRWKVRHDYGVGATDFRGAVTDAGA